MTKLVAKDAARAATLDWLAEILDRCGANKSRWPTQDRELLDQLLSDSTHAQALVRAAELLEEALDTVRAPEPSAALIAKLSNMCTPQRASTIRPSRGRLNSLFQLGPAQAAAAAALAAAVITVLATSYLQPDTVSSQLRLLTETSVAEINLDNPDEQSIADAVEANAEDDGDEDQIELTEVSIATLDVEQATDLSQLSLD